MHHAVDVIIIILRYLEVTFWLLEVKIAIELFLISNKKYIYKENGKIAIKLALAIKNSTPEILTIEMQDATSLK